MSLALLSEGFCPICQKKLTDKWVEIGVAESFDLDNGLRMVGPAKVFVGDQKPNYCKYCDVRWSLTVVDGVPAASADPQPATPK